MGQMKQEWILTLLKDSGEFDNVYLKISKIKSKDKSFEKIANELIMTEAEYVYIRIEKSQKQKSFKSLLYIKQRTKRKKM